MKIKFPCIANITILKESQDFIIPLNEEESKQFEHNFLAEGCRDPFVIWKMGTSRSYLMVITNLEYVVNKIFLFLLRS